jgi:hypothetical protein
MKKLILSVAILATCLSACKKKSNDPAPMYKTTSQYLTAHSWKTTGATADKPVNYDGNSSTPPSADVWSQEQACQKDDIVTFKADGTGTYVDAGVTCSTNVVTNFTWSLNSNNELVVNVSKGTLGGTYTQTSTITNINDTNLSFSFSTTDRDNLAYTETDSFVLQ